MIRERFIAIDNVCAWPNLTLLPDGTIVAIIFNKPSHLLVEGDLECWASDDGGCKWERRGTAVLHESGTARGNCAVGLAHNGDLVVLASGWSDRPAFQHFGGARRLPPWVCRSSDGGFTWVCNKSRGAVILPPGSDYEDRGGLMVKPFGDIVKTSGRGLAASFYHDRGTCWVIRSFDDGQTWKESSILSARCRGETAILRLRADRWLAVARTEEGIDGILPEVGMELLVSSDEGWTWLDMGSLTEPSQHPGHLLSLSTGKILMTYGMRDIRAIGTRISIDEGRTWSRPEILLHLETAEADLGYPASVELADGTLVTAYYTSNIAQHSRYHMGVIRWS